MVDLGYGEPKPWGLAPSGVQGQSPWSGGQGGEAPAEAERK